MFGLPFSTRSLDRLVDALLATHREFGAVASEGAELLGGPALDEETRREMQLRRFRTQAARAARETAYYRRLLEHLNLDPTRLGRRPQPASRRDCTSSHSRLISPYTESSDTSPFTMQASRSVPSRTKPSFSSTRSDALLRVSAPD